MQVTVLEEAGHEQALRGMAYSFKDRALDTEAWWAGQKARAEKRAPLLAGKEGGHNKFLESIMIWVDVEASRAFWSEFDTYRVGITKQSESTMHTLSKRPPTRDDFEPDTPDSSISAFIEAWCGYVVDGDLSALKCALPEGFLQRRVVCVNYKTIRNILWQRDGHRLKWWKTFADAILSQAQHPEYLK